MKRVYEENQGNLCAEVSHKVCFRLGSFHTTFISIFLCLILSIMKLKLKQVYLHFEKSANLKAAQAGLGILIDSHLRCKTSFLLTGCLVFLILR